MQRGFKTWLEELNIAAPSSYVSQIRRIESYYGDIDVHYEKDGCASLLTEFEYSSDDRLNKREKKHKIPIDPKEGNDRFRSYYSGTKDLWSRINKYIEYREIEQDGQLGKNNDFTNLSLDSTSTSPSGISHHPRPIVKKSRQNARYKGTPIGTAQNAIIRTILGNLGNESFSEKDWVETKNYFGCKCVYCGAKEAELVKDHAVPISKYKLGEHKLGNLVPACKKCNNEKGERDFIEFCGDDIASIQKIRKFMSDRNYVPMTEDLKKSENVRIVLHKAHEEVRIVAEKYIELINDLFFQENDSK